MSVDTQTARPAAPDTNGRGYSPPIAATPSWDMGPERRIDDGRTLARFLGWFSIGLGAVELVAPGSITDMVGVDDDHKELVQLYGVREIASGAAILAQRDPVAGVWSRVAGDALDLGTLGAAFPESDNRAGLMTAMAMVGGVMALDLLCASQLNARTEGD